jgi:hypothetical protein
MQDKKNPNSFLNEESEFSVGVHWELFGATGASGTVVRGKF